MMNADRPLTGPCHATQNDVPWSALPAVTRANKNKGQKIRKSKPVQQPLEPWPPRNAPRESPIAHAPELSLDKDVLDVISNTNPVPTATIVHDRSMGRIPEDLRASPIDSSDQDPY